MDLPGRLGSAAAAAVLVAEGVDMPDTVAGRAVYGQADILCTMDKIYI